MPLDVIRLIFGTIASNGVLEIRFTQVSEIAAIARVNSSFKRVFEPLLNVARTT